MSVGTARKWNGRLGKIENSPICLRRNGKAGRRPVWLQHSQRMVMLAMLYLLENRLAKRPSHPLLSCPAIVDLLLLFTAEKMSL